MSDLVKDFLESLGPKTSTEESLLTAIELLRICRDYVERHYRNAVYGKYQKKLLEVIDEFLAEQDDKNKST